MILEHSMCKKSYANTYHTDTEQDYTTPHTWTNIQTAELISGGSDQYSDSQANTQAQWQLGQYQDI